MLNKLKWILPLVTLAVMLGGCPYGSSVPMDATGKKINPALLGKWEPKSSSSDRYQITKDNDFTYKITKTSKDAKEPTIYKGYLVELDGDQFLNLWEENGSSDKTYYMYKVELNSSASKVTLSSVTENITEKFATGDEMKAFFKKYKGLSFFYDKSQDEFIKD
jgi:hypothetical protein